MKFITAFKEFHGDNCESVLDHITERPVEEKQRILDYLRSGEQYALRCACIYDYVEDEPKFDTILLFTDGEYRWNSEEIYHFEKYNIPLDEAFLKKVLSR